MTLLSNPAEADDAAQESFLKAFRALRDFRGDAEFSTWLYRIAFRHCQDELRKRTRRRTESLDAIFEARSGEIQKLLAEPVPPKMENTELLEGVLSSLPDDYRETLILREVQGLSYEEIAETMGVSLDSVKARLRRAREALTVKLRPLLKE